MKKFINLKNFYILEKEIGHSGLSALRNALKHSNQIEEHKRKLLLQHQLSSSYLFLNHLVEFRSRNIEKDLDKNFERVFKRRAHQLVYAHKMDALANIGKQIEEFGNKLVPGEEVTGESKLTMTFLKRLSNLLLGKSQEYMEIAKKEIKNRDTRARVMWKIVEYTNLYHESVQNLVEGQREVVRDENFKFEDGTTVKEKMDKFEQFLRKRMPKFSLKHKLKIPGQEE